MGATRPLAIVTGAGGGLGTPIVQGLVEDGYRVAGLEVSDAALAGLRDETSDRDVQPVVCDITDQTAVARVAEELGEPAVLVNAAGVLHSGVGLEDVTAESWRLVLDVNLTGAFLCTREFGGLLLDRGGAIVNIASIAGLVPGPSRGAYSASKAGLLALTTQTALEWGPRGVRANAVCPGLVLTPMSAPQYEDEALARRRREAVPMRRIGAISEVVDAVCFLASSRASYVNGEHLRVDGGFTLTPMERINA